jgi:lysozyme
MIDAVIDLSHWNAGPLDFAAAKASGVLAVIAKATEGVAGIDPAFVANRAAAKAARLLFGAYHYLTPDGGGAQAAHFLAQTEPGDLLALDFEQAGATFADAVTFVHLLPVTPVFYCGGYLKGLGPAPDTLTACPLWLAQYGPNAVLPDGWADWTLWQYSDGSNPPVLPVPGIGSCDRDRFNGTADELAAFWAAHGVGVG